MKRFSINNIVNGVILLFLVTACNYSNLKKIEEHYPDSTLKATGFKDEYGKYQGDFTTYYEDRSVKSTGHYKDGKLDGVVIKYDEDAKIVMKFKNDVEIDTTFQYIKENKNSNEYAILDAYTLMENGKETKEVFFYPNGKIKEIRTYYVGQGLMNAVKAYLNDGRLNIQPYACKLLALKIVDDSIQITPFGMNYNQFDSAHIMILKNFNHFFIIQEEPHIIQKKNYRGGDWVRLKLSESDYVKGKANIMIRFYTKDTTKPIGYQIFSEDFSLQLKKGEKLPKDNLQPIYFDE